MKISPSLASANPLCLDREVRQLDVNKYSDFHIDIEDGNFIPNITFGMRTVKKLRSITDMPFSFHLMVTNPLDYLDDILECTPSIIFAHIEALEYPALFLDRVKKSSVKVGLAFNPKTQITPYFYLLDRVDAVLIMTSEPDGMGQEFLPEMLKKAEQVKDSFAKMDIWVDGGVREEQIAKLRILGVANVVMGREIFGKG